MKGTSFSNTSRAIIDNTEEARDDFGHYYGSENIVLTREEIMAIISGKVLAFTNEEYAHFISYKNAGSEEEL